MPERHAAQAATPRANDGAAALDMERPGRTPPSRCRLGVLSRGAVELHTGERQEREANGYDASRR
jgi:hypothetical protein